MNSPALVFTLGFGGFCQKFSVLFGFPFVDQINSLHNTL